MGVKSGRLRSLIDAASTFRNTGLAAIAAPTKTDAIALDLLTGKSSNGDNANERQWGIQFGVESGGPFTVSVEVAANAAFTGATTSQKVTVTGTTMIGIVREQIPAGSAYLRLSVDGAGAFYAYATPLV